MASNRVLSSALLASGVLLIAACASRPPSSSASAGLLDEKYFQAEARKYQKFQHEGQVMYCTSDGSNNSLIPYTGAGKRQCISEFQLRQAVENYRRTRNATPPPAFGYRS